MAGTRTVQARARLRERLIAQEQALSTALRSAEGVETAKGRQRVLAQQGERLVAAAEFAHFAAVAELVQVMGSLEFVASVLDVKPAVVRKAVASHTNVRSVPGVKRPAVRRTGKPPAPTSVITS